MGRCEVLEVAHRTDSEVAEALQLLLLLLKPLMLCHHHLVSMPEAVEHLEAEVAGEEDCLGVEVALPRCSRLKSLEDFWTFMSWMTWIWFSASVMIHEYEFDD